jgi:hypothetical protein
MKKCKECNKEFEPTGNRGTEQVYCSKVCRNKAGINRYKLKLINNGKQESILAENKLEPDSIGNIEEKSVLIENNHERGRNFSYPNGRIINNDVIRLMEENYKTRTDLIRAELKLEAAQKEIQELRLENIELETELNSEPTREGIIGMLNDIPDWAGGALGNLLKSEKIVKFVETLIPEKQNINQ